MQKELLQYYAAEIAPINVWIHSEYNGYNCLVIPLAETQPVLRLAIIAIAAAHQPRQSAAAAGLSQWACQKALLLITERVRKLVGMGLEETHTHRDNDTRTSEAVLAATLVLSNYSLLESDICLALFHLQAARVLVKTLSSDKAADDDLFVFLKTQVAGLDILACTTLFSSAYIQDAVLPELRQAPVVFGSYLNAIHNITVHSIQGRNNKSNNSHLSLAEIEDEFELAQGTSLMAAGRLTEHASISCQRDITRLVQSFHHAGLLYACKRVYFANADQVEKHHVSKLFRLLEQFEDINMCLRTLSWPIFIGGICSSGNDKQIGIIRDLCCKLSANTTFRYYANILTFLEELWASENHDWAVIAREWEDKSCPILVI